MVTGRSRWLKTGFACSRRGMALSEELVPCDAHMPGNMPHQLNALYLGDMRWMLTRHSTVAAKNRMVMAATAACSKWGIARHSAGTRRSCQGQAARRSGDAGGHCKACPQWIIMTLWRCIKGHTDRHVATHQHP